MPKYIVELQGTFWYETVVYAEDEEEASDYAIDALTQVEGNFQYDMADEEITQLKEEE